MNVRLTLTYRSTYILTSILLMCRTFFHKKCKSAEKKVNDRAANCTR